MNKRSTQAVLVAVLAVLVSGPAQAFVCTQVNSDAGDGSSLSWFSRDVPFCLHANGTADVPGDGELDELRAAFTRWGVLVHPDGSRDGSPPVEAVDPFRTTDLEFHECPTPSNRLAVGYNYIDTELNENLLVFIDSNWPHDGDGATQDTETLALTTSTFNALTGEILDSDIEFNTANVDFSISAIPAPGAHDLLNTAVHEVGHFVGLAHTAVTTAVMYQSAAPGETTKRFLQPDDRNGVVFKYPEGEPNGYCDDCTCLPPRELNANVTVTASGHSLGAGGGCQAAGGLPLAMLPLLVFCRWLATWLRRRADHEARP